MKDIVLNFGNIKDTVIRDSTKEIIRESNGTGESKILNKFLGFIKKDNTAKIQYYIFENLTKGYFEKEHLADRYINESLKLIGSINWQDISMSNKLLRKETLDDFHVESENEQKEKLHECIHILIESACKKGFYDIDKSQEAYDTVVNFLTDKNRKNKKLQEENDMPKMLSWRFITELSVSNFNKRYQHLSENERGLLKTLLSNDDNKEKELLSIKEQNINTIDKLLKNEKCSLELKNTITDFKNKINSFPTPNDKNINDLIINNFNLKENLSDISTHFV